MFCGHSELYSATWPTSGTTRAGTAYEQPTSAPHTDDSASSSLLRTPKAGDGNHPGIKTVKPGQTLPLSAQLLKTPTAQLAINGGSQHPDKRRQGGHGPTLADQIEQELLLPTPRASDPVNGGPNQRGSSGDLMLTSAVIQLIPTPTKRDWKDGAKVEGVEENALLGRWAWRFSGDPTDQPLPDGNEFWVD